MSATVAIYGAPHRATYLLLGCRCGWHPNNIRGLPRAPSFRRILAVRLLRRPLRVLRDHELQLVVVGDDLVVAASTTQAAFALTAFYAIVTCASCLLRPSCAYYRQPPTSAYCRACSSSPSNYHSPALRRAMAGVSCSASPASAVQPSYRSLSASRSVPAVDVGGLTAE